MSEQEPRKVSSEPSYDSLKAKYDIIYDADSEPFGSGKPEAIVAKIPDLIKEGHVLDIGAGRGRNSFYLARHGFDVTAVELSQVGAEKLKQRAEKEGLNIDVINSDIDESGQLTNKFEVIISSYMLHHLLRERAKKLLENIKNQTAPGGVNAINVFTQNGDFYKNKRNRDNFFAEHDELKKTYSDWEIVEYFEEEREAASKKADGTPAKNVVANILVKKPG